MSGTFLMIVGSAVLAGAAWIVWRAARSRPDAGGDGGGIIYDGSDNGFDGSDCGGFGGDGGGSD